MANGLYNPPSLEQLVADNSSFATQLFQQPVIPRKRYRKVSVPCSKTKTSPPHLGQVSLDYQLVRTLPPSLAVKQADAAEAARKRKPKYSTIAKNLRSRYNSSAHFNKSLVRLPAPKVPPLSSDNSPTSDALVRAPPRSVPLRSLRPDWHSPWKLMRVISGHLGWVRSLAVEPGNRWFASGAGDRTIKLWDLASGSLKLTLTGHISTVRGLAVSSRHPYLFSCGEDKMVKCWDLETNKVIRHYHGHLSGVYALDLHPTLDILVTGGRDGVARVWDMRTRSNIHVLAGHAGTVTDIGCQEVDPQIITSSLDSTVRLWDLAAGKTMGVLTHHKKGVRSLTIHPSEFTFASGSTGSIKQWKCPEGVLLQNFDGHNAIINTLAVSHENILFAGGDNGTMSFWDWKSGHCFQSLETTAQPGSLDAETGIMTSAFDKTGTRLICGEADKTIKIWKPDLDATPVTHPLSWQPTL